MALRPLSSGRVAIGGAHRTCRVQFSTPSRFSVKNKAQRKCFIFAAAAAGGAGAGEDPYKVLGVNEGASSDSVQRAYRNRVREAKIAGNEEKVAAIEQAHSAIMMRQLTQRMQGGSTVPKDIAFADKAVYLPWRPRFSVASRNLVLASVGISGLLMGWSLLMATTAATQPLIASALTCSVISYLKLEELFPSSGGAFSASPDNRKQGSKNLMRAVLLAVMGTVGGILIFYTVPDLVSDWVLNKKLPYWFYSNQNAVLNTGAIVMNLIISCLYR